MKFRSNEASADSTPERAVAISPRRANSGVRFGDFSGNDVHDAHLTERFLLEAGVGRASSCLFAVAEIADLPKCDRIEVGAVVVIADSAVYTSAETIVRGAKQNARYERCITFAAKSFARGGNEIATFFQLGTIPQCHREVILRRFIAGHQVNRSD